MTTAYGASSREATCVGKAAAWSMTLRCRRRLYYEGVERTARAALLRLHCRTGGCVWRGLQPAFRLSRPAQILTTGAMMAPWKLRA